MLISGGFRLDEWAEGGVVGGSALAHPRYQRRQGPENSHFQEKFAWVGKHWGPKLTDSACYWQAP